jgi:hypothetical protein
MTLALDTPASSTGWLRSLDARWKLAGALALAIAALIVSGFLPSFLSALIAIVWADSSRHFFSL